MRLLVIGGVAAGLSAAARARRIDPTLEIVVLELGADSGERIRYDKLVVATGARPRAVDFEGAALPHVFTLHTLADAERLKAYLRDKQPKRAVVIGAGYIGLE